MDTYNLGFKIAHVLQGKADPAILKTYQDERHQTAQELIDLDYRLSRMFSAKPSTGADDKTGVSLEEFEAVRRISRQCGRQSPRLTFDGSAVLQERRKMGLRYCCPVQAGLTGSEGGRDPHREGTASRHGELDVLSSSALP